MTLEKLLRMTVRVKSRVDKIKVNMTPEFRVSVQRINDIGVHFTIHADGYDSETLDFICNGDKIFRRK